MLEPKAVATSDIASKSPKEAARTSRQGQVEPFTFVEGPSTWTAADYEHDHSWIHQLTPTELQELDDAVQGIIRKQGRAKSGDQYLKLDATSKGDFPLPTLGPVLDAIADSCLHGRGFALLKGLPVHRYSDEEIVIAYWGMGLYWGKAVPQNKKGHVLGHVQDIGHDPNIATTRIYATHAAQPWHTDFFTDLVGLLCIKCAVEGGNSSWVSSASVHNHILKHHPEVIRRLAEPWPVDRMNEVPHGKLPYFHLPIFSYHEGHLSTAFMDNFILASQRHPKIGPLDSSEVRALEIFSDAADVPGLAMHYILEPGDIQLLNNHTVLHNRSAYIDAEEPAARRHLLRLWLAHPGDVALPHWYAEPMGSTVPGQRGGIRVPGFEECIPLRAE